MVGLTDTLSTATRTSWNLGKVASASAKDLKEWVFLPWKNSTISSTRKPHSHRVIKGTQVTHTHEQTAEAAQVFALVAETLAQVAEVAEVVRNTLRK